MGLRDILTKPIGGTRAAFHWNEPTWYPLRLRGDLWLRLACIAAGWAGATGVMCILFAINVRPPGIPLAIGLGAVFGLGPACLALLLRRGHLAGRVKIDEDGIRRQRTHASVLMLEAEWEHWPFAAIEKCTIVPPQVTGRGFSLMLLASQSGMDVLGVPRKIELQKLGKYLAGHGVSVVAGKAVPEKLKRRLPLGVVVALPAIGAIVLVAGLVFYSLRVG